MIKRVLEILKSKTQSFGLNKEELKSVAEVIVKQLELSDDASDEDIESEITDKVDKMLPFIQLSQSMATRVINKKLSSKKSDDDDDDKNNDDDDDKKDDDDVKNKKKTKSSDDDNKNEPEWAKSLKDLSDVVKSLATTVKSMQVEKTTKSREERLSEILKDSGSYGNTIMRNFKRMSFDSDEAFDEFLSETEEELVEYNKEKEKQGSQLNNLSKPPKARVNGGDKKKEVLTDNELDELAKVL